MSSRPAPRREWTHRAIALASAVTLIVPLAIVTLALPAAAASAPGTPGTPVAQGMPGAAAVRWTAPTNVGSPPLTSYRVEANDGSGWTTAAVHHGADALAGGLAHTCAVLDDGNVKCWGANPDGELGLGDTTTRGDSAGEMATSLPAVSLGTGRTATAIAVGELHTCALLDTGAVKCWGSGANGRLGYGDTANRGDAPNEMGDNLPAVNLGTGRTATAISAGFSFTCALLDNATVKCWGRNNFGQLGQGDTASRGDAAGEMGDNLPAIDLGTGRTAVAIAARGQYACALLDNGTVKCWGDNALGQLGQGDTNNRGDNANEMGDNLPAIDLGAGRTAVSIASGQHHTCAVLDNGSVKCWGDNGNGQLGLGDTASRGDNPSEMGDNLPAVDLGTGRTATAITAGAFHTCALLDNATVKCWGLSGNGQLGYGDTASRGDAAGEMGDNLPAVSLGTGRTATAITSGDFHTCVLLDNAAVKCWGDNADGELGLGDVNSRGDQANEMGDNLPSVAVSGHTTTAVAVATNSACALLDDGTVKCWGVNSSGELGQGDTTNRGDNPNEMGANLPPVDLGPNRTATAIAAGSDFMCALLDNGLVKCWGNNGSGQLGQGDTNNRGDNANEMGNNLPPIDLGTGHTATAISAGDGHACALLDDATVKCWGHNDFGQLGLGDTNNRGDNVSEMGNNLPAVNLGTGRTALSISAGGDSTCALLDDHSVKCWGANFSGELGQGDTQSRGGSGGQMGNNLPAIDLGTGRTATAVQTTDDVTCAVLDDASVKCWGYGGSGRLGQGDTTNRGNAPGEMGDNLPAIDLGTGRTATAIGNGDAQVCALLDNASVKCWGQNVEGSLGLGNNTNHGDGTGAMGDGLPAVDLGTGRTVVKLAAGILHACAILDDGSLKCWGRNTSGQLGLGDTTDRGNTGGQMGDNLPVVSLSASTGSAPATSAIARLAPGTYQFRIVALNSFGESAPTAASNSVTVTGVPGAPTAVVGSGAVASATLTWTAPASDGGLTITDYAVSVFSTSGGVPTGVTGATTRTVGSATTSYTFTGLTNRTPYEFEVAAVNSVGTGPQSSLSNAIAPSDYVVPATAADPDGYDTGTVVNNSITLTASGSWCNISFECEGPDGDSNYGPGLSDFLLPGATAFSLIGRIGTSGPWTEIGSGPQTLNGNGELFLAMNEEQGAFLDNTGSLQVYAVANLQFVGVYNGGVPEDLTGRTIPWESAVNNHGDSTLTNVTLFASAANGLPTARTSVPAWRVTGSSTATPCTLLTPGTATYYCTIPSIPAGSSAIVDANVFAQGLAPQTVTELFAVGISDQAGGCFGFCPIHVPSSPNAQEILDGLQFHITAPATVQAGTPLSISGYVQNTSPNIAVNGVTTFGSIDRGSVISSPTCSYTNYSPTGATERCPPSTTFDVPAGTDTSAQPASFVVDTTGLAGQTIHYGTFATSPSLNGSSQVATGSVFVTAPSGGIAISTPANGATLARSQSNDFTAVPSPTGGDNITLVGFSVDNGAETDVAAPGPYTKTFAPNTLPAGTHTLTATMHQDGGGSDAHSTITVHIATAPVVSITPPTGFSSGAPLTTAKTFTALATSNSPATLASVVWRIDGTIPVPSAATSPYTATVNPSTLSLANGSHTLTATATDSLGQQTTASFNFTVPLATLTAPTVTPLTDSVTPGGDAAWTVQVNNTSANVAHHVTLTLNASATAADTSVSTLTFDTASINGALHVPPATATCRPGPLTSLVCDLGDLGASTGVQFPVFVLTNGVTNGSVVTGDAAAAAVNAAATAPISLGSVNVDSCGTTCVEGVAAAGTAFANTTDATNSVIVQLSKGLTSVAHGVRFGRPFRLGRAAVRHGRVVFQPRLDTNPSVKIQLTSINPLTATDPIDESLCPTPSTCVGQISGVDGIFTPYTNKADPIVVVIISKWGATVPGSGLWMQKPATGNGPIPAPFHLAACVINATTRAFNTPCMLPEMVKTLTVGANTTKTTYDTVLFTGNDPHFCRR